VQVKDDKESQGLLVMRRIEDEMPPMKIVPTFIGFSIARKN
jgi:hypothetical protein